MIDPKLILGINANDPSAIHELAVKVCGKKSQKNKIDEVKSDIFIMAMVIEAMGVNYDEKKLRYIVKMQKESRKKIKKINKNKENGKLFKRLPENTDQVEFFRNSVRETIDFYTKKIIKKIGKKDYQKIFIDSPLIPEVNISAG